MKNKLPDLRNHLFEQLERLSDENISTENLEKEVFRTDAMVSISKQLIEGAKVEVAFIKATGMKEVTDFIMPINEAKALENSRNKIPELQPMKKGKDVGLTALK
jgi:hypothetical protein